MITAAAILIPTLLLCVYYYRKTVRKEQQNRQVLAEAGDGKHAVAVGVGLHHRRQFHLLPDLLPEQFQIVPQGGTVDFNPIQHGDSIMPP